MSPGAGPATLLVTVAGDIHLKSDRTQRRLRRRLGENLRDALDRHAPNAAIARGPQGRMLIEVDPSDVDAAASAAARVSGIFRVVSARRVTFDSLDELVDVVAADAKARVSGRTFAARVRRRGSHAWSSMDAERAIGDALYDLSAGVSLTEPDVTVSVEVYGDEAWLLGPTWEGTEGLPVGTQDPVLVLLSGGFDSPVAAWLMLRRGCPVDFVHFQMDCSQADHTVAVAYGLWEQWGAGTDPVMWVIDFEGVKESLLHHVESKHRQVVLKQLMLAAADALAARLRRPALVTGESVGQVSSQTIANLVEIDRATSRTILRPLAGLPKSDIIRYSVQAGTHDLSARAKEVCDLATGPVEVAARRSRLAEAISRLPDDLMTEALNNRKSVHLSRWYPGCELEPATDRPLSADLPALFR
ncbi:MAG TPA: THUMP domain-containing protein [Acidimicrobiales bacterium]